MNFHRTRLRLYDYLQGSLPEEARRSVERHLARCARCARDLEELREAAALVPGIRDLSAPRADLVDAIIEGTARPNQPAASSRPARLGAALRAPARRRRLALAAALAAVAAAVLLIPDRPPEGAASADAEQMADSIVNDRVSRYLRTSRVLLTGLANAPEELAGDLSRERSVSRGLLSEARYLRRQPLDDYSAGVISDVERIMLKVANLPEQDPGGSLRMIRQGVDQRNLLFRVRMADQAYHSRTIVRASAHEGGVP